MNRSLPRIVISAPLLAPRGAGGYRSAGIHTYIAQTLRHLPEAAPDLHLTLLAAHPPADLPPAIDVQPPGWHTDRPSQRILWEQLALPRATRQAGAAALHATAFVAPWRAGCPVVLTIYDLSFALFPRLFRGFNQTYLRWGTRLSARRARQIVVISECTKRDVQRLYGVPADRITVAYPGVTETLGPRSPDRVAEFRRVRQLPDRFVLYLGTLEPRKNLSTLVQAFAELKRQQPAAVLVLAGALGWLNDDLLAAIETSGVKDSIRLPGFVPPEEKADWYAAATVFAYPSWYEGFGMPPLEALACGTPVIVSNTSALPEAVGDAGVLVAPDDVRGWAEALRGAWHNPDRAAAADRGLRQARQFTWPAAARGIAQAYRQTLAE